ncbi:MAG: hypothetical protein IKJ33_04120 [Clostridia bacterium]|nr:hypothetical protein [Clostridia bacterium]
MNKFLNFIKKTSIVISLLMVFVFAFSACSLGVDSTKLIPELSVNTDANLEYITSEEVYRIKLLPGDVYDISADLGTYEGTDYYIEYCLEEDESLLEIEENVITVSTSVEEETIEKVLVNLRKKDEEKIYQTETIEVVIVFEITE